MEIENFIFDFGGVLYEIAPERTAQAFSELSQMNDIHLKIPELYKDCIVPYEKGIISSNEFRNLIRSNYLLEATDEEFDYAWNQTLIGMFEDSIRLVREFSKLGRIVILSNSNELHYLKFSRECAELFNEFEECFFSYKINLLKPDPEIYKYVIEKMSFEPSKTIFIDDLRKNIESASKIGLKTFFVKKSPDLSGLLHSVREHTQFTL